MYECKETDRKSISCVAALLGGTTVPEICRTHHCVTLSSTEAVRGIGRRGKGRAVCEGGFVFPSAEAGDVRDGHPGKQRGGIPMAKNPLGSGRNEHIDATWNVLREIVASGNVKMGHVASGWQHADASSEEIPVVLCMWHPVALMHLPDET